MPRASYEAPRRSLTTAAETCIKHSPKLYRDENERRCFREGFRAGARWQAKQTSGIHAFFREALEEPWSWLEWITASEAAEKAIPGSDVLRWGRAFSRGAYEALLGRLRATRLSPDYSPPPEPARNSGLGSPRKPDPRTPPDPPPPGLRWPSGQAGLETDPSQKPRPGRPGGCPKLILNARHFREDGTCLCVEARRA